MTTDLLMQDVWRSSTMEPGELCVTVTLTTKTHKSPALCSDLGNLYLLSFTLKVVHFLPQLPFVGLGGVRIGPIPFLRRSEKA